MSLSCVELAGFQHPPYLFNLRARIPMNPTVVRKEVSDKPIHEDRTDETLEPSESKAIVSFLLQQHSNPEYVCRFRWEPGSITFWDNRAVQHYAASDYYPHERLLRRVTVSGDRPYYDPAGI